MSGFIKRIESTRKKLNSLVSSITITYASGNCQTLPVDSAIQEFLWYSAEIERIECDEPGNGLLAELLQGLKDMSNTEPLERPKSEPKTNNYRSAPIVPEKSPDELLKDWVKENKDYRESRQREIAATKPNLPSDNQHCI